MQILLIRHHYIRVASGPNAQGETMVKMPRQVKRYSPSAGKHTMHTVERVKKKRASELKWGQRRFRRVMAGYRGFPRPKPDGREKPTKRVTYYSAALKQERHTMRHANELRSSS